MLTLPMTHSPSTVTLHHPLGASTGWLEPRGDWPALVAAAQQISSFAVELAALDEPELPGLVEYLAGHPPVPFRYLSVHAPAKGRAMPEEELVAVLCGLRRSADAIVAHPDTFEVPERWRALGSCLVLENMDPRKQDARTVEELERYFDLLPDAGLCLDVAHAAAVAEGEADRLLDAFAGRLRHLHVSSLDAEYHHAPVDPADEEAWASVLRRCQDVPWILEAPLP